MPLRANFQFSQSSLHDYQECPRRFDLRYMQRLAWPGVEVEPIMDKEQFMRQGAAFHRLMHQYHLGVPIAPLLNTENLKLWWANFEQHPPQVPAKPYPEIPLSIRLGDHGLLAKFDLLAIEPGQRAVIVDWKTSPKRPRRQWLENHIQTRVYRYLLVKAGTLFNGGTPIDPAQVEMIYWFANFPDQMECLPYSAAQFEADEIFLTRLLHEIATRSEFPLTEDTKRCRFCVYRSLCERGFAIGRFDELEDAAAEEIVITAISEMEF